MGNQKFCDLCHKNFDGITPTYVFALSSGKSLFGSKGKKGEICFECYKQIDVVMTALKSGGLK